jgi:hypothetical protein
VYRTGLLDTFDAWVADPAVAEDGARTLRSELSALADPESIWGDPWLVERLVCAASAAEAFSMLRAGARVEDSRTEASLATSLFQAYLHENRHGDCARYFETFPSRIAAAASELDVFPEEGANELMFTAAMAASALR